MAQVMKLSAPRNQSGFTLIETVIAFAILALALGVLYESFGWSLRRNAVIAGRETAWLTAQSVLAEVRGREWIQPGERSGVTAQGLGWRCDIKPHALKISEQSPIKAFEVTVDVSWGRRAAQRVRLQSIEVGRQPS